MTLSQKTSPYMATLHLIPLTSPYLATHLTSADLTSPDFPPADLT